MRSTPFSFRCETNENWLQLTSSKATQAEDDEIFLNFKSKQWIYKIWTKFLNLQCRQMHVN